MSGQLSKSIVYEYAQALQVLDLAKKEALSPYVASLLAIIFSRSENRNCLGDIREWLFNYITPYLYSEPRNQADLREKTLAISTYYLVENPNDLVNSLPNEFLNKYIEYASKQDWYGDSFLAFIIGLLSDKHVISESALAYFKNKYSTFLEQQNIQAISQALFLIPTIGNSLRESGLEIIRTSIANPYAQTYEKSWGLIGISKSVTQSDIELQSHLKTGLYEELAHMTTLFFSKLFSTNTKSKYGLSDKAKRDTNQDENRIEVNGDIEETQFVQSSDIDVAELSLITLSILLSDTFFNLSIIGISENQIVKFLDYENKTEKGFVQISRSANVIGNILAVIFTFLAGILASIYLFGLRIENYQIVSTSNPALSDLLILPVWADYLLSQIQAVFRGESALEGMKEIPLLRHLLHFRKKKEIE
jgi:hypothetical protein